jgi:hypothetical protein
MDLLDRVPIEPGPYHPNMSTAIAAEIVFGNKDS